MQGDLTSLASVKSWLAPGSGTLADTNDTLLRRLISSASTFVISEISRNIMVTDYDEWYDSGGQNFLSLRQWPVIDVESVQFGSVVITDEASGAPPVNGWRIDPPSRLMVSPYCLPRGRSTVRVQYTAGYRMVGERQTVPEVPDPVAPLTVTTNRMWLSDLGVTLLDGTPLVAVEAPPGAGQYSVDEDGVYTLNAAQAEEVVLITYSYVPADLEQAVIELVGERYKQRDRIGMNSKSLPNGESVSFLNRDMSENVRTTVGLYTRRFQ